MSCTIGLGVLAATLALGGATSQPDDPDQVDNVSEQRRCVIPQVETLGAPPVWTEPTASAEERTALVLEALERVRDKLVLCGTDSHIVRVAEWGRRRAATRPALEVLRGTMRDDRDSVSISVSYVQRQPEADVYSGAMMTYDFIARPYHVREHYPELAMLNIDGRIPREALPHYAEFAGGELLEDFGPASIGVRLDTDQTERPDGRRFDLRARSSIDTGRPFPIYISYNLAGGYSLDWMSEAQLRDYLSEWGGKRVYTPDSVAPLLVFKGRYCFREELSVRVEIYPEVFNRGALWIPNESQGQGRWARTALEALGYLILHELGHTEAFVSEFSKYPYGSSRLQPLTPVGDAEEDAWEYASTVIRCN